MTPTELLALRAADGATVTLERYPILLGRADSRGVVPDVDVSHLDPEESVDNRHCELVRDDDGVEVRDLGGVSGTWVDGRRLPPGGRSLLRVGGQLRVGAVQLTLIPAPLRAGSPPAGIAALVGSTDWREARSRPGAPPPPSASGSAAAPPPPAEPTVGAGLDLTGAPALARAELDRGAEAVRLTAGFPLQARLRGVWTSVGAPLTDGELDESIGTVRRALGVGGSPGSGWGYAGDLLLEFGTPPATLRAGCAAVLARPQPPPPPLLVDLATLIAEGGCLLVAARRVEVALAGLAGLLDAGAGRPAVLSFGSDLGWIPPAWPALDRDAPSAWEVALGADPLFLVRPPAVELGALFSELPRSLGGTVIGVEAASVEGALETCARSWRASVEPEAAATLPGRQRVVQAVDRVLGRREGSWMVWRPGLSEPTARWDLEPPSTARGQG